MNSPTLPVICGVALTAMSTAGLSHWWSVRQFVAAFDAGVAVNIPVRPESKPAAAPVKTPTKSPALAATKSSAPAEPRQKEFYEALISKIENLQNQNRDLLDQVAETNRDLRMIEFRVDTHSEQFRPLPVSEERIDTSFEDDPGVLPPRAEPVMLPTQ